MVSRSLAVPVALSERTVRLEPPSHSELPSVPFTPRLTVRRHEALGGEPVAGATVALALFQLSRADGSATLDARPSPELDSAADLFHGVEWLVDGRPTALPPESANLLRDQPGCNGLTTSSEGRADTAQACALQLPSMGHFLLAACEEGGVCSAVVLGRSRPQWRRKPAGSDYLERALSPALDAETYARGETASIRVYNPLGSPLAVLVAWGNTLSRRHITPPPLPPGDGAVQLTLGEECVGGCRISLHLAAASNASRAALPGDVPTSLLLEPRAPMLASFDLAASVPSPANAITVSVTAARPVELPGAAGAVTVRLADASGSPVAGEVALLAVDRALLQLRPNPPVDVGGALSPDVMGGDYAATSSYEQLVSAAGLANASARLLSLLEADPFLRLSWRARASASDDWQLSDLERDPSDVLAANVGALTQLPSGSGGMYGDDLRHGIDGGFFGDNLLGGARSGGAPEMMLKAAPMMAFAAAAPMEAMDDAMPMARSSRSSAGRPPPATGPGVHVRSNFVTTPLFRPSLRVGPSGELTVPWTLPDNTGSFELRAYAVSDKGDGFGHGTAEQLVRKPLSLSASTPRIGRVGDAFSCGVTLTAAPDLPAGTAATVTLGLAPATSQPAPLSLLETNRTLSLAPSQTVEVAFEMRAVAIGSAVLTARVSASGAPADALELKLPILGQQPPVQLATSRALVATAAPSLWREGISLPRAVPGSGSLTATFGAGRLPAVEAIASALLRAADPSPPDAIDGASACLGLVGAHAALLPYAAGRSVPSLGAAAALAVESAAAPLEQLSNQYGLHNGPSAASYAAEHRTCNTQLTALGLFLLRKLALAGRLRALPALAALRASWTKALAGCLEAEVAQAAARGHEWSDFSSLALARLALGTEWQPNDPVTAAALSTERLASSVDSLSASGKAAFALAMLLPGSPGADAPGFAPVDLPDAALAVLRYLASSLRVRGRSAYLAAASGSANDAGAAASSYALAAFAAARAAATRGATVPGEVTANIDKLANGLAAYSSHGGALPLVALALGDYDIATSSTDASVAITAFVGAKRLPGPLGPASASAAPTLKVTTAAPPPPPLALAWAALPPSPPPFLVLSSGHGEVSFALAVDFVPFDLFEEPVSRGLRVERVIRRHDAGLDGPVGPPLASVPLGAIVTVTVQLSSVDALHNLLVDAWLPAGLEAVDPNADGGLGASRSSRGGGGVVPLYAAWGSGCWWWRCTAFSRETRPDRVTFSASWVSAGTHSVSFEAVAVTRGSFVLPPVKASCSLEPEILGLSASGRLAVVDPAAAAAPLPPPPPACDPACSERGRCHAGRCVCEPGFRGAACESAALPPPELDPDDVVAGGAVALRANASATFLLPVRAPFALALPTDFELLADGRVEVVSDEEEQRRLLVAVAAPSSVASDGCAPVLLALSHDGLSFSSAPLCVCFHGAASDGAAVIARHGGSGGKCDRDRQPPPPASLLPNGRGARRGDGGLGLGAPAASVAMLSAFVAVGGALRAQRRRRREAEATMTWTQMKDLPETPPPGATAAGHFTASPADSPGSQRSGVGRGPAAAAGVEH